MYYELFDYLPCAHDSTNLHALLFFDLTDFGQC